MALVNLSDMKARILVKLEDDRSLLAAQIADGGPQDFPAYREQVGVCKGLLRAQDIVKELFRKLSEDDE